MFSDLLDNEILSSKIAINEVIKAGSTFTWEGQLDYNQFMDPHKRLRSEDQANIKIAFVPRKVLFADGTKQEYD